MHRTGSPEADAWHEAGHALVAHLLGGRVRHVTLEADEDHLEGRAAVEWRGLDARTLAEHSGLVALAGPLAELAFQGTVVAADPATVSAWSADWDEVQRCAAVVERDGARREALLGRWVREVEAQLGDLRTREHLARIADALDAHGMLDEDLFLECVE